MKKILNNPAYYNVIRNPRKIAAFLRQNYVSDLMKSKETREYAMAVDEGITSWEKAQYEKK